MSIKRKPSSPRSNFPAVLAALAAVVTAVAGLVAVLNQPSGAKRASRAAVAQGQPESETSRDTKPVDWRQFPVEVRINRVPGEGGGPTEEETINGEVRGLAKPDQYKVVVYAYTDRWYVQPEIANPLIDISPEGTWTT
ncbi:MAG TPA: hypothetical protein VIH93_13980, partial [Thermoanaerobaculia bacterium]